MASPTNDPIIANITVSISLYSPLANWWRTSSDLAKLITAALLGFPSLRVFHNRSGTFSEACPWGYLYSCHDACRLFECTAFHLLLNNTFSFSFSISVFLVIHLHTGRCYPACRISAAGSHNRKSNSDVPCANASSLLYLRRYHSRHPQYSPPSNCL